MSLGRVRRHFREAVAVAHSSGQRAYELVRARVEDLGVSVLADDAAGDRDERVTRGERDAARLRVRRRVGHARRRLRVEGPVARRSICVRARERERQSSATRKLALNLERRDAIARARKEEKALKDAACSVAVAHSLLLLSEPHHLCIAPLACGERRSETTGAVGAKERPTEKAVRTQKPKTTGRGRKEGRGTQVRAFRDNGRRESCKIVMTWPPEEKATPYSSAQGKRMRAPLSEPTAVCGN
eukprot:4467173-Pleurochrysis_carterae.AAC.3